MLASMNENALREFLKIEVAAAIGPDGADMDLMALQDYIVVLLKRDNSEIELKNACENELVDFLGANTNQFVRKMFNAIRDGIFDARAPQRSDSRSKRGRRTILTTRQSVLKVTMVPLEAWITEG